MSIFKNNNPKFQHDCDACRFLGRSQDETADLYSCTQDREVELIARYSDEPSDNRSWSLDLLTARTNPHIQEAARLHLQIA